MQTLVGYSTALAQKRGGHLGAFALLSYNHRAIVELEQQKIGSGYADAMEMQRALQWQQELLRQARSNWSRAAQVTAKSGVWVTGGDDGFYRRLQIAVEVGFGNRDAERMLAKQMEIAENFKKPFTPRLRGMKHVLPGKHYGPEPLGRDLEALIRSATGRMRHGGENWKLKDDSFVWRRAYADTPGQRYGVEFALETEGGKPVRRFSQLFNVYPELGGAITNQSHQFVVPEFRHTYGHREAAAEWMVTMALDKNRRDQFHYEYMPPDTNLQALDPVEGQLLARSGASGQGHEAHMLRTVSKVRVPIDTRAITSMEQQLAEYTEEMHILGRSAGQPISFTGRGKDIQDNWAILTLTSPENQRMFMKSGVQVEQQGDSMVFYRVGSAQKERYAAARSDHVRFMRDLQKDYEGTIHGSQAFLTGTDSIRNVSMAIGQWLPGAEQVGMGGFGVNARFAEQVRPWWTKSTKVEVSPHEHEMRSRDFRIRMSTDKVWYPKRAMEDATRGANVLRGLPHNWDQVKDELFEERYREILPEGEEERVHKLIASLDPNDDDYDDKVDKARAPLERLRKRAKRDVIESFDIREQFSGAAGTRLLGAAYYLPLSRRGWGAASDFLKTYKSDVGLDLGLLGGDEYMMSNLDDAMQERYQNEVLPLIEDLERAFDPRSDMTMKQRADIHDRWQAMERRALEEAQADVRKHGKKAKHAWAMNRGSRLRLSFAHPYEGSEAYVSSMVQVAGGSLHGMTTRGPAGFPKATLASVDISGTGDVLETADIFAFNVEGSKEWERAVAARYAATPQGRSHLRDMKFDLSSVRAIPVPKGSGEFVDWSQPEAPREINKVANYLFGLERDKVERLLRDAGVLVTLKETQSVVSRGRAERFRTKGELSGWKKFEGMAEADKGGPVENQTYWFGQQEEGRTDKPIVFSAVAGDPDHLYAKAYNVDVLFGTEDLRAWHPARLGEQPSTWGVQESVEELGYTAERAGRHGMSLVQQMAEKARDAIVDKSRRAAEDFESMFRLDRTPVELKNENIPVVKLSGQDLGEIHNRALDRMQRLHRQGRRAQHPEGSYVRQEYDRFFRGKEHSQIVVEDAGQEVVLPSYATLNRVTHSTSFGSESVTLGKIFNRLPRDASNDSAYTAARSVRESMQELMDNNRQVSQMFHGRRIASRHTLQGADIVPLGAHVDVNSPDDMKAAMEHGWTTAEWKQLANYGDRSLYHNGLMVQVIQGSDNDADTIHAMTVDMGKFQGMASQRFPISTAHQTSLTVGLGDYWRMDDSQRAELTRHNMAMIISNQMGPAQEEEFMQATKGVTSMQGLAKYLGEARKQLGEGGIQAHLGAELGRGEVRQHHENVLAQIQASTFGTLYDVAHGRVDEKGRAYTDKDYHRAMAAGAMGTSQVGMSYDKMHWYYRSAAHLPRFLGAGRDAGRLQSEWSTAAQQYSTIYQTALDNPSPQRGTIGDVGNLMNSLTFGQLKMARNLAMGEMMPLKEMSSAIIEASLKDTNIPRDPALMAFSLLTPDTDMDRFWKARSKFHEEYLEALREFPREKSGQSNLFGEGEGRDRMRGLFTKLGRRMGLGDDFKFDANNRVMIDKSPMMLGAFAMAAWGAQRLQRGMETMDNEQFEKEYGVGKGDAMTMLNMVTERGLGKAAHIPVRAGVAVGRLMDIHARAIGGRAGNAPLSRHMVSRVPELLGGIAEAFGSQDPQRQKQQLEYWNNLSTLMVEDLNKYYMNR